MKRLASQITLTAISHVIAMLAIISAQIVLARVEPLRVFGAFAAAQALIALAEIAITTRGGEVAIQYMGKYWTAGDPMLKAIERRLLRFDAIYCFAGCAGFALFAMFVAHRLHIKGEYVAALALAIPLQIGFGIRRSLFVVSGDMRAQAYFEIMNSIGMLVLTVGLTLLFGVWGMIAGSVASAGLKNLLVHWRTRRYWTGPAKAVPAKLDPAIIRGMRAASGHSVLRNLLNSATNNADVLLLGMTGRPEILAVYRVARTLSSIPARLAAPLWTVLRPRLLVALRENDHRRYCLLIGKMAAVFAAAMTAAVPLVLWLGPHLLHRFYGPAFVGALTPFVILFVGSSVFGAVTGWLFFTLVISSRKALGSAIFAVQLVLIVTLGWLIGRHSATHMALVVCGCNILLSAVAWTALLTGRFRSHDDAAST